jgi:juvenile-hormone esterase
MDGDGGVRALSILEDKLQLNDLNKRFNELMPKLMEIENPSAEINEKYLEKIKTRYFDGHSKITEETSDGLIRLYTERSFVAPMINTARDSKTPTYLYKFSFKGPLSYSTFYTGRVKNYGSVHCDELVYLLDSPLLFPNMTQKFTAGSTPALFRTKFVKFITSFAVNG